MSARISYGAYCSGWIKLLADKNNNRARDVMETLLLPFSPRFIVLTICAVVTALLLGIGIFDITRRSGTWC